MEIVLLSTWNHTDITTLLLSLPPPPPNNPAPIPAPINSYFYPPIPSLGSLSPLSHLIRPSPSKPLHPAFGVLNPPPNLARLPRFRNATISKRPKCETDRKVYPVGNVGCWVTFSFPRRGIIVRKEVARLRRGKRSVRKAKRASVKRSVGALDWESSQDGTLGKKCEGMGRYRVTHTGDSFPPPRDKTLRACGVGEGEN